MERVIQAILDSIEEQEKTVIRICGHGASGKTTLAKRLYQVLPKDSTYLLETDAYIISNSSGVQVTYDLKGVEGCYQMPACHSARHELASLKRDILMFRKGMDLLTIDTSWSPSQIISGQGKLLIVEGMSSTFLEKELFDLSVFCDTDNETELQRRLQRDTSERGRQAHFVMQSHQHRRRQYQLYLEPVQKNGEFLLNQSQNKCLLERKT